MVKINFAVQESSAKIYSVFLPRLCEKATKLFNQKIIILINLIDSEVILLLFYLTIIIYYLLFIIIIIYYFIIHIIDIFDIFDIFDINIDYNFQFLELCYP
jgi:hypothetical protein